MQGCYYEYDTEEKAMSSTVKLLEKISSQQQQIMQLKDELFISEQKLVCASQQMSAYQSALMMLPQSFYWITPIGLIQSTSLPFNELLSLPEQKILRGMNLYDVFAEAGVTEKCIQQFVRNNTTVITQKEELVIEEQLDINGNQVTLLSYKIPVFTQDNKILGVVSVSYDISKRKQEDREKEEHRSQQAFDHVGSVDFLSKSRHDIRTPLLNLIGLAKVMQEKNQADDLISDIYYSAKQLERMIEEILDFTTKKCLEEPRVEEEFSIEQLVTEVKGTIRILLEEKQVMFNEHVSKQMNKYVLINRVRLQRIITNLCINAIKHARSEGLELSITPSNQFDTPGMLVIVKDHGVGIPARCLAGVLDGQRMVDGELTGDVAEGMGLKIIAEYVSDLGGVMNVSSQVGVGTEFRIHIPYKVANIDIPATID